MSTATDTTPARSRSQVIRAVIFAVVAVAFIAFGILIYFAPGHLFPRTLAGGTPGHHPLRVTGSVLVGLAFAVAAGFALKSNGSAGDSE